MADQEFVSPAETGQVMAGVVRISRQNPEVKTYPCFSCCVGQVAMEALVAIKFYDLSWGHREVAKI